MRRLFVALAGLLVGAGLAVAGGTSAGCGVDCGERPPEPAAGTYLVVDATALAFVGATVTVSEARYGSRVVLSDGAFEVAWEF